MDMVEPLATAVVQAEVATVEAQSVGSLFHTSRGVFESRH